MIQIRGCTALLDFNHPLAGKTLPVDLKVAGINWHRQSQSLRIKSEGLQRR